MRPQHERIAEIFDESGKNGKEIAAVLGISEAMVSRMRKGTVTPSDRTISTICKEFLVCEKWLTDEVEPKYAPKSRAAEIAEIARKATVDTTPGKREALVKLVTETLSPLNDGQISTLYELAKEMGFIKEA